VTVTGAEIAQSTLPEALELVMGRVADTLYYEGSDAATPLFAEEPKPGARPIGGGEPDPNATERSLDPGPFGVLSEDSHKFLRPVVLALALVSLLPLALLVVFSRGFGRLGSPGLAVLIGVAPVALLTTLASRAAGQAGDQPDGLGARLASAVEPATGELSNVFLLIAGAGATAVVFALLCNVVAGVLGRSSDKEAEEEEAQRIARPPRAATTYESQEGFSGFLPSEKGSVGPGGVPQT
jgi:hypothetical protein